MASPRLGRNFSMALRRATHEKNGKVMSGGARRRGLPSKTPLAFPFPFLRPGCCNGHLDRACAPSRKMARHKSFVSRWPQSSEAKAVSTGFPVSPMRLALANYMKGISFCREMRRHSFNQLLVMLFFYDLLFIVCGVPVHAIPVLMEKNEALGHMSRSWLYGTLYKNFLYPFTAVAYTGSVYMTVAITVERCGAGSSLLNQSSCSMRIAHLFHELRLSSRIPAVPGFHFFLENDQDEYVTAHLLSFNMAGFRWKLLSRFHRIALIIASQLYKSVESRLYKTLPLNIFMSNIAFHPRYIAVCKPLRYRGFIADSTPFVRTMLYACPVAVFAVALNIPKFLEVEVRNSNTRPNVSYCTMRVMRSNQLEQEFVRPLL